MSAATLPTSVPPPPQVRPRVQSIGTALAGAAVLMAFASLLGIYTLVRSAEIDTVRTSTQEATCLGFLESHESLGERVGASAGGSGSDCVTAMRVAAVNEGACNATTGRPEADPDRDPAYNLADHDVPACEVLSFVDDPEIRGSGWLPSGVRIPLSMPTMNVFTLLISAGTAAWAVWAARNRVRGQALVAIGATVLLGLAYINQAIALYSEMGLVLNETRQAVLIYAITGLHIALVAAAIGYFALMALRTVGGQLTGRDSEALFSAAMFWFVTVGIYVAIWYVVLVQK